MDYVQLAFQVVMNAERFSGEIVAMAEKVLKSTLQIDQPAPEEDPAYSPCWCARQDVLRASGIMQRRG